MPIEAQELARQAEEAQFDFWIRERNAADKIQKFLKGHRGTMFSLAELEEAIGLDRESFKLGLAVLRTRKMDELSQQGIGMLHFGYYK